MQQAAAGSVSKIDDQSWVFYSYYLYKRFSVNKKGTVAIISPGVQWFYVIQSDGTLLIGDASNPSERTVDGGAPCSNQAVLIDDDDKVYIAANNSTYGDVFYITKFNDLTDLSDVTTVKRSGKLVNTSADMLYDGTNYLLINQSTNQRARVTTFDSDLNVTSSVYEPNNATGMGWPVQKGAERSQCFFSTNNDTPIYYIAHIKADGTFGAKFQRSINSVGYPCDVSRDESLYLALPSGNGLNVVNSDGSANTKFVFSNSSIYIMSGNDAVFLKDGGILVCCTISYAGYYHPCLIRFNSNYEVEWATRMYVTGYTSSVQAREIHLDDDENAYFVYSYSIDGYVFKFPASEQPTGSHSGPNGKSIQFADVTSTAESEITTSYDSSMAFQSQTWSSSNAGNSASSGTITYYTQNTQYGDIKLIN